MFDKLSKQFKKSIEVILKQPQNRHTPPDPEKQSLWELQHGRH